MSPDAPPVMRQPPVLATARLRLRAFVPADAPRVRELAGDRRISDTALNIPYPYEAGMAEEWIATHWPHYRDGLGVHYAVVLAVEEVLIGAVGLMINRRHQRGELGYWIGVPWWGQGYCTEAAGAVVRFAFGELGLHRVYATHLTRNPASGRVMAKLGMRPEGIRRHHLRKDDRYEDVATWGLLSDDAPG